MGLNVPAAAIAGLTFGGAAGAIAVKQLPNSDVAPNDAQERKAALVAGIPVAAGGGLLIAGILYSEFGKPGVSGHVLGAASLGLMIGTCAGAIGGAMAQSDIVWFPK